MAGYNFNFYLDEAQSKVEKEFLKETTITLLIRRGQFKIKYRTAIKVRPDQWDKIKQEIRRNKVGYATDNNYLGKIKNYAKDIFIEKSSEGIQLTHSILKSALDEKLGLNQPSTTDDFLEFIKEYIADAHRSKEKNTIKGYVTTQNHLLEFFKTSDIPPRFEAINLVFYDRFKEYSFDTKKHSTNTFGTNIKNIKTFLHESFERELHNNTIFQNRKFKVTEEVTYAIALTNDEINKIYKLDLSKTSRLERVRDIFYVACMTGIRYSDFSKVTERSIKSGMIEIIPTKTKNTSPEPVSIPILGFVPQIFDKYRTSVGHILPRVLSNQKMNEFIKEIGDLAEINELIKNPRYKSESGNSEDEFVPKFKLISMHTARRSFATNFYIDNYPILDIMRITGHKTIKSFMKYIRMSNKDAALRVQATWVDRENKLKSTTKDETQSNSDDNQPPIHSQLKVYINVLNFSFSNA